MGWTSDQPLLKVENLVKHFPVYEKGVLMKKKVGEVHAVDGVTFSIAKGRDARAGWGERLREDDRRKGAPGP